MIHTSGGKPLSDVKIKALLRQYRMMGTNISWSELGRRCGVCASTAKKYIKRYIEAHR